jgi:hypothetical protein
MHLWSIRMLVERGVPIPGLVFYGIGVICLCVVMFMLGSTMTLWTMQFALDQTDNALLEGLSLPTTVSHIIPTMPVMLSRQSSGDVRRDVNEQSLLRPPITIP